MMSAQRLETQINQNTQFQGTLTVSRTYINLSDYEIKQLITKPTRETEYISTIIDHIAVNTNNIVEFGVVKTAISDHHVVYYVRKYQGAIKHGSALI